MAVDGILPDKLYFKIGEVARIVGVKPYVLRYWETEFPSMIKPSKSPSGQRLYRRRDVELLLAIKNLLYQRRYTIEGARKHLNKNRGTGEQEVAQGGDAARLMLQRIESEVDGLLGFINGLPELVLPHAHDADTVPERAAVGARAPATVGAGTKRRRQR